MTSSPPCSLQPTTYGVENPGVTPFTRIVAAHYHPVPPEDVRDRIALPDRSPESLHDIVQDTVRGFTHRPGRHNRYVPVPGELAVRTADLVDFLFCYGHEYQLTIFRAADVRTGSLLDVAAVHAESRTQGSACAWDWTGASDWLPWDAAPQDAAFIFWSTYVSLIDGTTIPAGFWVPGEEAPPAELRDRVPFTPQQHEEMRAHTRTIRADINPARILHPLLDSPPLEPGMPVLVLARSTDPGGDDLNLPGAEVCALIEDDGHITVVPWSGATSKEGT